MNKPAANEQIAYAIIDVLLCLEPQDKARQQIFQILSQENSPNTATARLLIKDALRDNGHAVEHERIQLCIVTFQRLTNGFARWFQEPSEVGKELYPAWELTKLMSVEEVVNWTDRWQECGGKIYSGDRMVAPMDDPIWLKISDFGLPFPPFALNSGMDREQVSRHEFIALGGDADAMLPQETEFGSDTVKVSNDRFDPDLLREFKRGIESGDVKISVKVTITK